MVNHYRILGIGPKAGLQQIRAAYHRLALRYHLDQRMPLAEGNPGSGDDLELLARLLKKLPDRGELEKLVALVAPHLHKRLP